MNRPDNMSVYDELDLKLGIKSSLPHVKNTIALVILLWECANRPAELVYSQQNGESIVVADDLNQLVISYLSEICQEDAIDIESFMATINENQLFKSQMEALIVAFELVWKLAEVSFVDEGKAASAERTGGTRYPKKLLYTVNADIIHSLIESNHDAYIRVLMAWIGVNINIDLECEAHLVCLLNALSEGAVFKMMDGEREVIFNQNSLYSKVLETQETVDINGDQEAKGSLRILKSLLSEGLNPYLSYSNGSVSAVEIRIGDLEAYQRRVDTFLRLSATRVIGLKGIGAEYEGIATEQYEEHRLTTGCNVLLYGVPGSGKSWTIEHEYCNSDCFAERLVFHPDYTNADFVGQILPVVDDKQVTYEFTPGPFTSILKRAYNDPCHEYILIIEEINRGNAPAIFGEIFQLLDRTTESKSMDETLYPEGTSEYGITNENMAEVIYNDSLHKVRIPSNLSIIGTMNTSDQNVYTLDTAFQRRWHMRLIENNFDNVNPSLANAIILDTEVTWKHFCETINDLIVGNKAKMASAEDKRLGVYFIHERDLTFDDRVVPSIGYESIRDEYDSLLRNESAGTISDENKMRLAEIRAGLMHNRIFPEKVIKYLWDDAFKFNPEALFATDSMNSLEKVIRTFEYSKGRNRFKIFNETTNLNLYSNTQT